MNAAKWSIICFCVNFQVFLVSFFLFSLFFLSDLAANCLPATDGSEDLSLSAGRLVHVLLPKCNIPNLPSELNFSFTSQLLPAVWILPSFGFSRSNQSWAEKSWLYLNFTNVLIWNCRNTGPDMEDNKKKTVDWAEFCSKVTQILMECNRIH